MPERGHSWGILPVSGISWWEAAVLGMVEGATEFLPISSTGHLIIVQDLLGHTDEASKVFNVAIQLGAILAVCWYYRDRLWRVTQGLGHDPAARRFVLNLFVAFLPAALIGLVAHKAIKTYLFSPLTVALALALGAVLIFVVERWRPALRIQSVDDMRPADALKVGFAQSLALIPGTSRSGATIIGGMAFGLSRQAATEFSFFLAIPTMFAAVLYDLAKSWSALSRDDLTAIALGFAVAFVSALAAVRFLLGFVARHSFVGFAWYRLALALVVWAYFAV
ncbi:MULTISPECIES: undecaprenyl-diphosphate phosphatase [Tepidiphilus]|jgi:undecaprenyl-diphosphatase|uniref:Undecaprenyl-diphosphatase n=1 Tax=Tepidiphilus thermophilus TaxID=876478 RepID=A0A0K6IRK0_9PROT|nr:MULTISPECIES: undecaprenyl-diphosphate phosphatase [Tepidiphilus]MDK2797023.1 undecaprenyl-diphosphatase [Tepidiphilus sp.]CUB05726.1 undecaprenyl-diphosphatase UppP [Tepidiphilus thermophilus]